MSLYINYNFSIFQIIPHTENVYLISHYLEWEANLQYGTNPPFLRLLGIYFAQIEFSISRLLTKIYFHAVSIYPGRSS